MPVTKKENQTTEVRMKQMAFTSQFCVELNSSLETISLHPQESNAACEEIVKRESLASKTKIPTIFN
jgi:hypothetical protein